jgi:putative restriction endonuclease
VKKCVHFFWGSPLYEVAKNKETVTYGALANKMGLHHRTCRYFLDPIQQYCMKHEMPPLTILAVNQSGVPGEGFIAWDIENKEDGIRLVHNNAALFKKNPFSYANEGSTIEELSEKHFSGKLSDKEVLALLKVRGAAQDYFKNLMRKVYKGKCAFCGMDIIETLQAAHIIGWSECKKKELRVSPENGILLCANHHLLFDKGFLIVDEEYKVILGLKGKENNKFIKEIIGGKCLLPDNEKHYPSIELIKKKNEKLSVKKKRIKCQK